MTGRQVRQLRELMIHKGRLTGWERCFVTRLVNRQTTQPLSQRQGGKLNEIYTKRMTTLDQVPVPGTVAPPAKPYLYDGIQSRSIVLLSTPTSPVHTWGRPQNRLSVDDRTVLNRIASHQWDTGKVDRTDLTHVKALLTKHKSSIDATIRQNARALPRTPIKTKLVRMSEDPQ